jgi:branched-chain amino acid transport system substrate-binding protein
MRIRSIVLGCALLTLASASGAWAQVSGNVVKIGILNDQAGMYAHQGGMGSVIAAQMAAEDFGGTVLGAPIVIVTADHQNKPDVALNIARRWYDLEGVDAVMDVPTSSVALAINDLSREKNRIAVFHSSGTSDLTGKGCSPTGFHWMYDTYALAAGTGRALLKQGGDSWFFVTADFAFGQAMERDATRFVQAGGGKVLGSVRHPMNNSDFSSFLVQAQASKAKIVALANGGGDMMTATKQAYEFGFGKGGGQRLAALLAFISEIESMGLEAAQGLVLTTAFYWDMNDQTRAWSRRFMARFNDKPPTMPQAGVYSSVMHYLKAIKAAGTDDAKAVAAKMKELPLNDMTATNVTVREDGRVLREMYLMQVKSPAESRYPHDDYKLLAVISPADAWRPLEEGGCPYVTKK